MSDPRIYLLVHHNNSMAARHEQTNPVRYPGAYITTHVVQLLASCPPVRQIASIKTNKESIYTGFQVCLVKKNGLYFVLRPLRHCVLTRGKLDLANSAWLNFPKYL